MNPELEALLKAWDAYLQAQEGEEADRLLEQYDARLEEVCSRCMAERTTHLIWLAPLAAAAVVRERLSRYQVRPSTLAVISLAVSGYRLIFAV